MKTSKVVANPMADIPWQDGRESRSGQFWADGPEPCSIWVVPYERYDYDRHLTDGFMLLFKSGPGAFTADRDAAFRSRRNVTPLVTAELF